MSESSYFFLVRDVKATVLKKTLKQIKHSSIMFRPSSQYTVVAFEGEIEFYREVQQKLA